MLPQQVEVLHVCNRAQPGSVGIAKLQEELP